MESSRNKKAYSKKLPSDKKQLALMAALAVYPESGTDPLMVEIPIYNQFWFVLIVVIFLLAIICGICVFVRQTRDRGILRSTLQKKT